MFNQRIFRMLQFGTIFQSKFQNIILKIDLISNKKLNQF